MSLRRFFRRWRSDAELLQEIDTYLAEEIAENMARGMSPEEARRQAHVKFGNPQRVRESLWQQNTITTIDTLWRELKYAVRTLARTPGFAAIAILVMALGIGGNVALFTVVRSVLLKPLPYRDADRLFALYEHNANSPDSYSFLPVDAGSFWEWQRATQSTAEMALISPWQDYSVSADGGKLPEKISAGWCSWNFFPTLGITPALGRSFTSDDDRPQAMETAVLTYSFWKRRYSGDPEIVGKIIFLDARPYTVVGVLPASFTFSSAFGGSKIQVWTPVQREAPHALLTTYEDHEFLVFARLRKGGTLPRLADQLNAIQAQIQATHPDPAVHGAVIGRTMLDDVVYSYKTSLYALLAATGCVLLIACMNVAGLLVARSAARSKDLAIRAALGGGRLRLLRERLVESLILSAAGGALGLLLAWIALGWLVHVRGDMNRVEAIHIDGTVAAFTVGVIALCALFSGLISALSSNGTYVMVAPAGVIAFAQRRNCARETTQGSPGAGGGSHRCAAGGGGPSAQKLSASSLHRHWRAGRKRAHLAHRPARGAL
jgi:predicted permease